MNNERKATLLHKDQVQYTIDSSDRNEIYQLHRRPDPAIYSAPSNTTRTANTLEK